MRYEIKINIEREIEADSEEEAVEQFYEGEEGFNHTLINTIDDNMEVTRVESDDLKWIVATHRKNLEKKDMFYNSIEEAQAQNPDFYNFTMVGTEEQFKRFDEQEVSVEQVKSVKVPKKRNVGTFWNTGLWGQK